MRNLKCFQVLVLPLALTFVCLFASGCGESAPPVSTSGPADPAKDPTLDPKNSTMTSGEAKPVDPTTGL